MLFHTILHVILLAVMLLVCITPLTAASQKAINRPITLGSYGVSATKSLIQEKFAPRVDHHQHLLSKSSAEARLPPTIQLPEMLRRLMQERELRWSDSTGLVKLFVENGVLFTGDRWISSHKPIADYLANGYTGPYRFKPISYRVDESTGQIAGYMIEDDGSNVHFAFFHLGLSKGPDGAWRIKSETQIFPGPAVQNPVTAEQLIRILDSAGVRRAVVPSNTYYFGVGPSGSVPDEYNKVRAENDWTAQQVAQFPARLVAFCSFNPLRDYALSELEH